MTHMHAKENASIHAPFGHVAPLFQLALTSNLYYLFYFMYSEDFISTCRRITFDFFYLVFRLLSSINAIWLLEVVFNYILIWTVDN